MSERFQLIKAGHAKRTKEQIAASNEKRKQTMLSKYGHQYNSQRNDVKTILKKSKLPDEIAALLSSKDWLEREYVQKERTAVDIAKELKIFYGTVIEYAIQHGFTIRRTSNYSLQELELQDWLASSLKHTKKQRQ